jgi:TP901 family phage tail tape measure protein
MNDRTANVRINVVGNASAEITKVEQAVKKTGAAARDASGKFVKAGESIKKIDDAAKKANGSTEKTAAAFAKAGVKALPAAGQVQKFANSVKAIDQANTRATKSINDKVKAIDKESAAWKRAAEAITKVNRATNGFRGQGGSNGRFAAVPAMPAAPRIGINEWFGRANQNLSNRFGNIPGLGSLTSVGGIAGIAGGAMFAVAASAAAAAAAFGAAMTAAVAQASELESAMSRVRAATAGSRSEMAALTRQAADLGAATQFSAAEVAAVQENFAKAGFSVEQITRAAPAALSFAAASGTDTGFASSLIAQAVRSMGFEAGQSGRISDVLMTGAQASNVDVTDLNETLKYAAPIFSSMGRGQAMTAFQDLTALAGILGDQGIRGSSAGTSLRAAFTRLSAPSGAGGRSLRQLGVSTTDSEGNMRRMPEILADLRNALEGKSTGARQQALTSIFGMNAAGAMGAIINADPARFSELVAQLDASGGAAERTARIMQDNLTGDLEQLGGAFGGLGTSIGNELLPGVRSSVQGITDFVGAINSALGASGAGTTAFGSLGDVIGMTTDGIISGMEAIVPRIAGFAELVGILDEGQGSKFAADFAGAMGAARVDRAATMAQRQRDQIENESNRRRIGLDTIKSQVEGAQGASGATLSADVRRRFTERGLGDLLQDPNTAAALAAIEGTQGPISARDRRRMLRSLSGTLDPGIEAARLTNDQNRERQLGAVGAAELEAQNSILGATTRSTQAARRRARRVGDDMTDAAVGSLPAAGGLGGLIGSLFSGGGPSNRARGAGTDGDAGGQQLAVLRSLDTHLRDIANNTRNTGQTGRAGEVPP